MILSVTEGDYDPQKRIQIAAILLFISRLLFSI